ncbi:MAG TPA: hypothetical protein VJ488_01580 [Dehalococcoidia bacterium]|nr:hypothetical protein [Dehalococcoidia bacterium]
MTDKFKALASLSAWILFIFGCLRLLVGLIQAFASARFLPEIPIYLDFLTGIASITLSVVVMKLRKSLE